MCTALILETSGYITRLRCAVALGRPVASLHTERSRGNARSRTAPAIIMMAVTYRFGHIYGARRLLSNILHHALTGDTLLLLAQRSSFKPPRPWAVDFSTSKDLDLLAQMLHCLPVAHF
jgi:hypothetical protein